MHDTFDLDQGLTGRARATGASLMQVTHRGVEAVEIDTRGGDDRLTVKAIHTRHALNTSSGDDVIDAGNAAGTLNEKIGRASCRASGDDTGQTARCSQRG